MTERREHPRVALPIEVELAYPAVGSVRTTATDISEGGITDPVAQTTCADGVQGVGDTAVTQYFVTGDGAIAIAGRKLVMQLQDVDAVELQAF